MDFDSRATIEIHFTLPGAQHSMDCLVLNQGNQELIRIVTYLASLHGLDFRLESEALAEGGLREVWHVLGRNSGQITVLLTAFVLILTITPVGSIRTNRLERENLRLQNEKLRLEIQKLQDELGDDEQVQRGRADLPIEETLAGAALVESGIADRLTNEPGIIRARSDFYASVQRDERVRSVDYSVLANGHSIHAPALIPRERFGEFIRSKEELPEIVDNSADIYLVSPVLVDRKFKWSGIYNGDDIRFYLNDHQFRNLISTGEVQFTHGDVLTCELVARQKLDESGVPITTSYAVTRVLSHGHEDDVEIYRNKRAGSPSSDQIEIGFDELL